jgi:hypothetical protein
MIMTEVVPDSTDILVSTFAENKFSSYRMVRHAELRDVPMLQSALESLPLPKTNLVVAG